MRWNPLQVSLETLVAASPLMGQELESRRAVSEAQQSHLAERLAKASTRRLRSASQRDLFCVAPLDLLVSEQQGRRQFHLLELNGTGIGGLTNLTDRAAAEVLGSLAETSGEFDDPDGVVLIAVSGKESRANPRLNRLMHEKLLFVEAVRHGLSLRFGASAADNLASLRRQAGPSRRETPSVALGYIKELLAEVTVDSHGEVWLHGRRVMGAVNDRFCRNLLHRFDDQIDLDRLRTLNRCFAAGSDKGLAYALMNEYVQRHPQPFLPREIRHAHANSRLALIETVLEWLALGRQVVIKPHGTGLGHGIEFFFDRREPLDAIVERIDRSLAQTEEYYDLPGGALPYTVCEYVDTCRVQSPLHPLCGHKYELRVVVYRHDMALRAFPSIAKIARERDDAGGAVRRALINNITASGDTAKVNGADFMLPLCNEQTLSALGLCLEEIESICAAATGYVRYVLDQVEDRPERFGLPAAPAAARERELQLAVA